MEQYFLKVKIPDGGDVKYNEMLNILPEDEYFKDEYFNKCKNGTK